MAHKWDWYMRDQGPGQLAETVSHTFVVAKALRSETEKIALFAKGELALHRDTGASHITTHHYPKTDLDSYVELVDWHEIEESAKSGQRKDGIEASGKGGAAGIEMRHGILAKAMKQARKR